MIKRTIKYYDSFDNMEKETVAYFDIDREDVILNPELLRDVEKLNVMFENIDPKESEAQLGLDERKFVFMLYKNFIKLGYVKRVGDKPVKNDEVWGEFDGSFAYKALVNQFFDDPDNAMEFLAESLPEEFRKNIQKSDDPEVLKALPQDHKPKKTKKS